LAGSVGDPGFAKSIEQIGLTFSAISGVAMEVLGSCIGAGGDGH
jgi:hypothetical protein